MYINLQENQASRSVKSVDTKLFAKYCKLHKFATCSSNFKTKLLQTCITPMSISRPNLKTFSLVDIVKLRSKVISTDDKPVQ